MSWATFFYVFSSILLVVTMAVALVAIFLKKHPIKTSEKFENEHDRDIQTVSKSKKSSESTAPKTTRAKKVKKSEIEIDLSVPESKTSKKDDGGIV